MVFVLNHDKRPCNMVSGQVARKLLRENKRRFSSIIRLQLFVMRTPFWQVMKNIC